ncbi:hypothetical protein M011DRAFT_463923 [Sporormia fimetaria CBS 119925]|uniref:Uncharacterized protein n=1 Tax=Sporormia fimetaria CBS 119925 TaxID=1340428 RepID=A0A6A6VPJ2_9PLEO|nr:hypothetical protein M011DRAFT_463923 [Sporormia fimetaria CBS 119925]
MSCPENEAETVNHPEGGDAFADIHASKFRIKKPKSKSKTSSRHHRSEEDRYSGDEKHRKRRASSDRHRERDHDYDRDRRKKRRREHRSSRSTYDFKHPRHGGYDDTEHRHRESLFDGLEEEAPPKEALDPDDAFRESLFDALADDEGAEYWEGVYGQPIHVYPNTKPGPDGELEEMTDEEYANYVRTKMWEKTHQHILEEREARERARKKATDQKQKMEEEVRKDEEEREHIRRRMQESLKRGEERKKAKAAQAAWSSYTRRWEDLRQQKDLDQTSAKASDLIPWPVVSGRRRDVSKDAIEFFFVNSPAWQDGATACLKAERFRWHPDKMQHRFGQHIDPETMKSVTAVFQVVDKLWSEHSGRK